MFPSTMTTTAAVACGLDGTGPLTTCEAVVPGRSCHALGTSPLAHRNVESVEGPHKSMLYPLIRIHGRRDRMVFR